jgi:uncharacterized phage protein gp47/JayE
VSVNPDLTPYVGPALVDPDPEALVRLALDYAVDRLPGWVVREGQTEAVLMEAMALEVAELGYLLNRLPETLVQAVLGRLLQLARDMGAAPVARARFDVAPDAGGREVPAGTRLQLDVGADAPMVFTTTEALAIPAEASSGEVGLVGADLTSLANGRQAGARFDLVDSLAFVDAVVLVSEVTSGRDAEDVEAYLNRGVAVLARMVSTLLLPDHFALAAQADPAVGRARAVDLYDPGSGLPPGQSPGHMTVAVLGPDGEPLPAANRAALEASLTAQAVAFLVVHVVSPTLTAVNVTVRVVADRGADGDVVHTGVETALRDYLSPATWRWSGVVRHNELVALVSGVPGVDYVPAGGIITPAADLSLTGVAPLPTAGAIVVDVVSQ